MTEELKDLTRRHKHALHKIDVLEDEIDNLVERLRNWEKVYEEDYDKPEGSLYLEAADRIEELEAELKEQALQYLSDTGQLGERIGELTEVLEEVDAWVESLGYYADEGAELVPVFKKVKAVLKKGYY